MDIKYQCQNNMPSLVSLLWITQLSLRKKRKKPKAYEKESPQNAEAAYFGHYS